MTGDELLIREAIEDTMSRYVSAIDRGAYEELSEVFTPDAVVAFGSSPPLIGHRQIIDTMTAGAEGRGSLLPQNFQRHLLGSAIINVLDGKTARCVHYVLVLSEKGPDLSGVYLDDFVKSGARWLVARRSVTIETCPRGSRYASAHGSPAGTPRPLLNVGFVRPIGG